MTEVHKLLDRLPRKTITTGMSMNIKNDYILSIYPCASHASLFRKKILPTRERITKIINSRGFKDHGGLCVSEITQLRDFQGDRQIAVFRGSADLRVIADGSYWLSRSIAYASIYYISLQLLIMQCYRRTWRHVHRVRRLLLLIIDPSKRESDVRSS